MIRQTEAEYLKEKISAGNVQDKREDKTSDSQDEREVKA